MNTVYSSMSCLHLRLVLLASERSAGKSMTTPFGEKQAVGGGEGLQMDGGGMKKDRLIWERFDVRYSAFSVHFAFLLKVLL